jgi:hypothetical protein
MIDGGTGSTGNHISQIFFVFAAPMHWWDWLAVPVLMVCYKEDHHVSHRSLPLSKDVRYLDVVHKDGL